MSRDIEHIGSAHDDSELEVFLTWLMIAGRC